MKKLRLLQQGIVYRNPLPGHCAICAFHPNVVPLSEKEVLCFYRMGQAMYSLDGRIAKSRSTDGGLSWTQEGLVWDTVNDAPPGYSYTAPCAARMKDGSLIMIAQRFPATEEELIRFNPDTGGYKGADIVLFRSQDKGRSWSKPELLDLPVHTILDTHAPIIELENGRWTLACEVWKVWDDPTPLHIKGFALFSDDAGRSWADRVDFPSASDSSHMYSHSQYRKMRDGRLIATQWTQSIGGQDNLDLHLVISDPTGTQWPLPQPTGIRGQTSCLADLGSGTLVVAYSLRETMKPGVMVVLSRDNGKTWDMQHQQIAWDAVGQEFLGVAHKPCYPASHDNIAFGKPEATVLPDDSIIVAWWCTQACVTHVRYAKLVVE